MELNNQSFKIIAKKGLFADINTSDHKAVSVLGELAYATDTKELYIFDGTDYVRATGVTPAADGTYANPTSITIVNGVITAIS